MTAAYHIDPQVLEAITAERQSQIDKWGRNKNRPDGDWLVLLVEEVGEVARDIQEKVWKDDCDRIDLEEELTQVAALAVAWLEESKEGRCGRKS